MVVVTAAPRRSIVILYILAWFFANGATVIFNKYIFKTLAFSFPFALTLIHMSIQSALAYFTIDLLHLVERVPVEPRDYYSKLIVISVVFCSNICLGNVALRFVPVSFMQTVKSLTPAATALLQNIIFGSRLTKPALISLIPVNLGVAIASATELEFHMGGFIAALVSCVFTGLKFVLSSQMLGSRYKLDSINLLYYMAPPSALFLTPVVLWFEAAGIIQWYYEPARTSADLYLLLLSGIVSFALNVTLFVVLKATSSVTVTVAGNVKTVLVIAVSIMIFKNQVTLLNIFGCFTAIAGCLWYGLIKDKWETMGTMNDNRDYKPVESTDDQKEPVPK